MAECTHGLFGLLMPSLGVYQCPNGATACLDLCARCQRRIRMKADPDGYCVDCFHDTHVLCAACCWKDAGQDDPCNHYYRPNCPECRGVGWFVKPEAADAH